MIAEISVVPVGSGESLSRYIAEAIKVIENSGNRYELSSMGTIIEVQNYLELGELLENINNVLISMGVKRVYIVVKTDFRVEGGSIEQKKISVIEKLEESGKS